MYRAALRRSRLPMQRSDDRGNSGEARVLSMRFSRVLAPGWAHRSPQLLVPLIRLSPCAPSHVPISHIQAQYISAALLPLSPAAPMLIPCACPQAPTYSPPISSHISAKAIRSRGCGVRNACSARVMSHHAVLYRGNSPVVEPRTNQAPRSPSLLRGANLSYLLAPSVRGTARVVAPALSPMHMRRSTNG